MSRIKVKPSHHIKDETLYIPIRHIDHDANKHITGFTIIMFRNEQFYVCDGVTKANGTPYKIGSVYTKNPKLGGKLLARSIWGVADQISRNESTPIDTIVFYREDNPHKIHGTLYRAYRYDTECFI